MSPSLQIAKTNARGNLCKNDKDNDLGVLHHANMVRASKKPTNNLRAWREFHKMSQDELAAKVGTNGSVISLLESGSRNLSLKWLLKLAPVLKTSPGFLLDHDPDDLDTRVHEILAAATETQKEQFVAIARTIIGTGTDGR